jgi:hypothetical protein
MSTKKLEWLFALDDKMSGPASTAEKKLGLLERRIKSVSKAEAEMSGPRKEKLTFARLGLEIQRDQLRGSMKAAEDATSGWLAKLDHDPNAPPAPGAAALSGGQITSCAPKFHA